MPEAPTTAVMPLGKVKSKPVDISRDSPMTVWLRLMASPAAPKTGRSPLELDGYLTGVIVAPQAVPILPSRWVAGLWGDAEPVFGDDAQIDLVARAVMDRYGALVLDIDRGLERLQQDHICDYRPMFMPSAGKPAHEAVRRWARGFWRAVALAGEAWLTLASDDRANILIGPFVDFFEPDQGLIDIPDDAILDESAAAIPRAILALHALATMYSRSNPPPKTGRNDPCPCGSGQKYKRCCGRN
jgi:uncharacterized protein